MGDGLRIPILGIGVDAQTFERAIQTLLAWTQEKRGRYVSTCPVYTLMLATENPAVRAALDQADMVAADGMPIVWLQRRRGVRSAERVYGPDILLALCQRSVELGLRHFFLGGETGVASQLADTLRERFPGLQVAGMLSPSIEQAAPDPALTAQILASDPQVVWVGLGSPKQDLWMAANKAQLPVLMIGVGAAFDFLTGRQRQAPLWARNKGLEWLFRLLHQPGRLWRRYLIYNPRFVLAVLREELRRSITGL